MRKEEIAIKKPSKSIKLSEGSDNPSYINSVFKSTAMTITYAPWNSHNYLIISQYIS